MPPRRQTTPLSTVRASSAVNDQLSPAQVLANAGTRGTAEDLVNALASQLRRALGNQSWLEPPGTWGGGTASSTRVRQEVLSGPRDGSNLIFTLAHVAVPGSVEVCLNGQQLTLNDSFVLGESTVGGGIDSVVLRTPVGLRDRDQITASYDLA